MREEDFGNTLLQNNFANYFCKLFQTACNSFYTLLQNNFADCSTLKCKQAEIHSSFAGYDRID